MRTTNYVILTLFFVLSGSLVSCGDDIYYTDDFLRNSDEILCSKEWVDEYESDGKLHQHILLFYMDGKGKEKIRTWRKLPNGQWSQEYSEINDPFTWSWFDKDMEGLYMDFYGERECFFDNVWIREHYLSGKMNGVHVTFIDKNYMQ